jgi:hypothetical protein
MYLNRAQCRVNGTGSREWVRTGPCLNRCRPDRNDELIPFHLIVNCRGDPVDNEWEPAFFGRSPGSFKKVEKNLYETCPIKSGNCSGEYKKDNSMVPVLYVDDERHCLKQVRYFRNLLEIVQSISHSPHARGLNR